MEVKLQAGPTRRFLIKLCEIYLDRAAPEDVGQKRRGDRAEGAVATG
jgi:hypothetical protein